MKRCTLETGGSIMKTILVLMADRGLTSEV